MLIEVNNSKTQGMRFGKGGEIMNEHFTSGGSGGVGFLGLLQIAFIILKLCKVIKWSWLWVLSPLWGSATLTVVLVIIVLIYKKVKKF